MTGKLKRYGANFTDSVSAYDDGDLVRFADVEAFLRELIAMAEEANRAPNRVSSDYYNYGDGYSDALENVAYSARALLGEEGGDAER